MSKMRRKDWLWFMLSIVLGLVVVVVITLIASGVFLLYFLSRSMKDVGERTKEKIKYDYFRIDPNTNDSFTGFTTLPYELDPDKFVFYIDESGTENLISNFGTEKYRCTGICECESEEERRGNALLATRTFTYLVAALSSVLAFDLATDYFGQMCRQPPRKRKQIKEVEACFENYFLREVECDAVKNEFTGGATTQCFGRCLPRTWTNDGGSRYAGLREEYSMEDHIALYTIARDLEAINYDCEIFDLEMFYEKPIYYAEELFIEKDLYKFCKAVSKIRLSPSNELQQFLERFEISYELREQGSFLVDVCTSGRLDPTHPIRKIWTNHHVKCTEDRPMENRLKPGKPGTRE